MTIRFIMGTEPIGNFAAFQSRLESMGINRLVPVYQSMYERYSANLRR
jgi:hypothetical protein